MTTTATDNRTAIISVSRPRTLAGLAITAACGTQYRYIRSMEHPHFAALVECTCLGGHGTSALRRRYWLSNKDAVLAANFADITPSTSTRVSTAPALIPSPADIDVIPIDVLETLDLDQVAAVAATYRQHALLAVA